MLPTDLSAEFVSRQRHSFRLFSLRRETLKNANKRSNFEKSKVTGAQFRGEFLENSNFLLPVHTTNGLQKTQKSATAAEERTRCAASH